MEKFKKFTIPKTRDPFVNVMLKPAGRDAITGKQRFWTSSANPNSGSMGLLIDEDGNYKIYKFGPGHRTYHHKSCFYAAVYDEPSDTIWLCGDINCIYSLNLNNDEIKEYETGVPARHDGLVTSGIAYDEKTGKILFSAYKFGAETTVISFDIRAGKTVKQYDIFCNGTSWGAFDNGDGTHTYVFLTEAAGSESSLFWQWNPLKETMEEKMTLKADINSHAKQYLKDSQGRAYLPNHGWLNTTSYQFEDGPQPERDEVEWFALKEGFAYGSGVVKGSDEGFICRWDMASGKVKELCRIPDSSSVTMGGSGDRVVMTDKGEIIAVNIYGEILKFSSEGKLLLHKVPETVAVGAVDCLIEIDDKRILGTPFITQRFWTLDTETGEGWDMGRAGPAAGEILVVWNLSNKIYMGSYASGCLTEYDPKKPTDFPNNPRVVAAPPNALRPICGADDGVNLFYFANRRYGYNGSAGVKYNSITGEKIIIEKFLDDLQIRSLYYNKKHQLLIGGSTYLSDAEKGNDIKQDVYAVLIDPNKFEVVNKITAPIGFYVHILAQKDDDSYYVLLVDRNEKRQARDYVAVLNLAALDQGFSNLKEYTAKPEIYPYISGASYLKKPSNYGAFVTVYEGKLQRFVFDGETFKSDKVYMENAELVNSFETKNKVYGLTRSEVYIFDY